MNRSKKASKIGGFITAPSLSTIANAIDRLNETIGRVLGWLTLLMVLVTFAVVVLRYGFDWGSIAMQESVNYLHALVFMAGAAYTLKRNEHVRVDIVYTRLSDRGKAWVDLLGTLVLLLPFCIFLIWISLPYVRNSWQLLEGSREAGGLPLVYLLKSFIPLMGVLLLLQGLSLIARSLRQLGKQP
jgi:TRAP-type mannitol/chloroaromatic compound transport system permease small subunit